MAPILRCGTGVSLLDMLHGIASVTLPEMDQGNT